MEFPLWLPFENEWWTFCILLVSILTFVIGSKLILNFGFLSPESNRRLVHVTIGILVTLSPLIFSRSNEPSMLALAFIILNILAFNDERFKGIHSQRRITYGTIYFPIAYLILTMGFWQYTEFMIISLSLLALSDPFAAFIGERTSNKIEFIVWDDKKTLQGTVAFFFSALFLVYFISQLLFNYSNMYLLLFAVFTATGATIAEITSSKGSDNISIPIVTMLFMIGFLEIIPSSKELMIDVLLSEKIVSGEISSDEINETLFSQMLYTKDIPDPDLLIRTGGEFRISNFLLWQIAYTEIHITQTSWPAFGKKELIKAIFDYQNRERRYGKISEQLKVNNG